MGSCTRVRRSTLGVIVHGRRLPSAATADALIVTDAFAPLALRHQPWPRRLSRGLVNLDLMRLQWGEASGICRNAHCARRCGREAEGGGLLNRYRVVKLYRGFESLRLRHVPNSYLIVLRIVFRLMFSPKAAIVFGLCAHSRARGRRLQRRADRSRYVLDQVLRS
jgi:hypothetical protein